MSKVFAVMAESLDRGNCGGAILYMSLDKGEAIAYMDHVAKNESDFDMKWDEDHDMWINRWEYGWDKLYIEDYELNTPL